MSPLTVTSSDSDDDDNKTMLQAYKGKDKSKGKNDTMIQAWIVDGRGFTKCPNKTHEVGKGCTGFNPSCNLRFVGDFRAWRAKVQRKRAAAAEREEEAAERDDANMLGQGLVRGGAGQYLKERNDYLERVKAHFPPLSPFRENYWREFKKSFERIHCRLHGWHGTSYGAWFARQMKELIQERRDGHADALQKWMDYHIEAHSMFLLSSWRYEAGSLQLARACGHVTATKL